MHVLLAACVGVACAFPRAPATSDAVAGNRPAAAAGLSPAEDGVPPLERERRALSRERRYYCKQCPGNWRGVRVLLPAPRRVLSRRSCVLS